MLAKSRLLFLIIIFFLQCQVTQGAELSLDTFIAQASKNDTVFESILLDKLILKHRKQTLLPPADIIVELKSQYSIYLDQNRNSPQLAFSLQKLFPIAGTSVSLAYRRSGESSLGISDSSIEALISQPIARNAFGKNTRLLDRLIDTENQVMRYQIIEAYEDYFASLMTAYYNWYSAYENLQVSKISHQSNLKLLQNIKKRQRQNIALPVDVNKIKLLVLNKEENIANLQERYTSISNIIFTAIRDPISNLKPQKPKNNTLDKLNFAQAYQAFTQTSRTHKILRLLEQQSDLEVQKSAHELLPSTDLLLGYQISGNDWPIENKDKVFYAGVAINWNLQNTVQRNQQAIEKIKRKKTILSNGNRALELRSNLFKIYQQIEREKRLIQIAQKKIALAKAILKEEVRNYSYGKVSLNDYLDAVNRLDENRFNAILHSVQLSKLTVEWLRLNDDLVHKTK